MSVNKEFQNLYSGEEANERMSGWKEKASSPADTYIEWAFENKCKQLSDGFRIITEWRKRKLQYVAVMKTIIMDFQHYSRHDVTHSICILEMIEQLLGKQRVDLLSAGDLWLLLEAAYSHDIGMATTYEQMVELWDKDTEFQQFIRSCIEEDMGDASKAALYYKQMDNLMHERKKMEDLDAKEEFIFENDWPVISQYYIHILVAEYIRKHHAERVDVLFREMDKETDTVIPLRLYRMVVLVSQMHGREFNDIFNDLKYCTNGFGSGILHPQFAAAMIRIGDLLDIDNNRFDPYSIKHFGRLPFVSLLHKKKHSVITHICVSESEIAVEADTEEYEVAILTDEWFQMIDKEVNNLICVWNEIVPEALRGCTLKKSNCKVFLKHCRFDSSMKKEFSINKKKIINLLIGTNIYNDPLDFIREYLQNAMDASKMQLWMDLKAGKYETQRNQQVFKYNELNPFDLERSVYNNYPIRISIQWNDNKNKIRIQIIDHGIGIEKEYFEKVSNIGTGWRGREAYSNELMQMTSWLRPTGGFGIGIQSAFMVTDTVEMITKSDKDIHGHKVRLESPNAGGSISVEEYDELYWRGTTIIFELEPEKFQGWMERQRKQTENNFRRISDELDYLYDLSVWDEFDSDGILIYIQKFFYNYISTIIPNPLFPVEIDNSVTKRKVYENEYWPKENYWENLESDLIEQWSYNKKQYLGIYVQQEISGFFLVWDKQDCVLTRISKSGKNKFACFKNVLVPEKDDTLLNLFCKYSVCIDFMGFPVDNCLKLHRISFHEEFHWERYCYEAFRMYVHFLWKCSMGRIGGIQEQCKAVNEAMRMNQGETPEGENEKTELQSLVEKNAYARDTIISEWMSYDIQLLRMIAFYDLIDQPYQILKKENKKFIQKILFTNDKDKERHSGLKISSKNELVNDDEVLETLHQYYEKINDSSNKTMNCEKDPIIVLVSGNEHIMKNIGEVAISPKKIEKWVGMGKAEYDGRDQAALVFNTLQNGIGIINDIDTVDMLLSDARLNACQYKITSGETSYLLWSLIPKEEEVIIEEGDLCNYFWQESSHGRRYVTGKSADKYPQLRIKSLPYRFNDSKREEIYLLSPTSNYNYRNIVQLKNKKRKLSYEDFRELIWGKRGSELPEYQMLIEWVFKHQVEANRYTKDKIAKAYDDFLFDIYKECVYEV